jgi:hypothetical protein
LNQDEESPEETEQKEEVLERTEKKWKLEGLSEFPAWTI